VITEDYLGTAAVANVTTSRDDTTAGRLVKVGDFGLGNVGSAQIVADLDAFDIPTGFYLCTTSTAGTFPTLADSGSGASKFGQLIVFRYNATNVCQIYAPIGSVTGANRVYTRVSASGPVWLTWREQYDSGNLPFTTFGRTLAALADAAAGRTALGLGTIATQAANNVAITGGSIQLISSLGVGRNATAGQRIHAGGLLSGSTSPSGVNSAPIFDVGSTGAPSAFISATLSAANSILGVLSHFRVNQITLGSDSTVSVQAGLYINDLTVASTNYGVYSNVSDGSGRWNIYANGSAPNFFAGNVRAGGSAHIGALSPFSGRYFYMRGRSDTDMGALGLRGSSDTTNIDILNWTPQGRVSIGPDTPTTSALLDLQSTTLGFLPPRMTTTQRNAISSPAEGLVVHDTTVAAPYVRKNSNWRMVATSDTVTHRSLFEFINPALHTNIQNGTDTTDLTASIQSAVDSGENIFMPIGRYKVTDRIQLNNGQIFQGAGRTKSRFWIRSDFNLSATGVVRLGTGEPGALLFDVGFEFDQPTAGGEERSDLIQYPWAIDANAIPRFHVDRIRVSRGWLGLDAVGNTGGSYVGRIEFGCFETGVKIDGALDFFHGGHWHFWPFGMTGSDLVDLFYEDGLSTSVELGEVDGLSVAGISTFRGKVVLTSGTLPLVGRNIGVLQLDGNGARLIGNGRNLQIGECYSSKSAAVGGPDIEVTAGRIMIGNFQRIGNTTDPAIDVSGGYLQIASGFLNQSTLDASFATVSGGTLEICNSRLEPPDTNRTVPYIEQTGGVLVFKANRSSRSSRTGPLVEVAADNALHDISDNHFGGFSFVLPSGAYLGCYGPNRARANTFLPVLTFATPGDLSVSYTVRNGLYWHESNGIRFEIRILASSITYTTASGSLRVAGLPISQLAGFDLVGDISVVSWSKITLTSGYTALVAGKSVSADVIAILQTGSGEPYGSVSTSNIASGTTNVEISLAGFIPTFN
jgi:hypothetical protein